MSFFATPPRLSIVYPHPCDNSRPLFFILDTVHIFNCIRNNWLNQKSDKRCILYPPFNYDKISTANTSGFAIASFDSLKQLHYLESGNILKHAYKLSSKALFPTNLGRQNVRLVLQVFNDFVSQGLLQLGEKHNIPHFMDTSTFIKIITTWWEVVNVKTPRKGLRLNNIYQQPLISKDTSAKLFLHYFADWLERWKNDKSSFGNLSNETFTALIHTTNALLEVATYCLSELGADYVLLGKFQTDSLEARFGQYRQLAGGKYDVSLRQVFECEKKIRISSVLQLTLKNEKITLTDFTIDWDFLGADSTSASPHDLEIPVTISNDEIASAHDSLPVINYIAGYCAYSINKKLGCDHCRNLIVADGDMDNFANFLIRGISRGSLLFPSADIVRTTLISYLVINKITATEEFSRAQSQRSLAVNSILAVLDSEDLLILHNARCLNNHEPVYVTKMVAFICSNILLNNFCS